MQESKAIFGDEEGFHTSVRSSFGNTGAYEVTIWTHNSGMSGLPPIRDKQKAKDIAEYLYIALLPEYLAERERLAEAMRQFDAKRARKPKPKPPRVPKNTPILTVFECPECGAFIEERGDDHVYECGTCGATASGDEGRQCEQCHKFTAKISETSCPECGAGTDEAETVEVKRATDGTLVQVKAAKS